MDRLELWQPVDQSRDRNIHCAKNRELIEAVYHERRILSDS